jgi:hypothetical protein
MPRRAPSRGNAPGRNQAQAHRDTHEYAPSSSDSDASGEDEPVMIYEPDEDSEWEEDAAFYGAKHAVRAYESHDTCLSKKRCFICVWLRDGEKRFHIVHERRREFLNMLNFRPGAGNVMYRCNEACDFFNKEIAVASNRILSKLNEIRVNRHMHPFERYQLITPWIVIQHLLRHDPSTEFAMYYLEIQLGRWSEQLHKYHSTKIVTQQRGMLDNRERRLRKFVDLDVMRVGLKIASTRLGISRFLMAGK